MNIKQIELLYEIANRAKKEMHNGLGADATLITLITKHRDELQGVTAEEIRTHTGRSESICRVAVAVARATQEIG